MTTDIAEIEDGVVRLRGRLGDRINVAGRKLDPEIVETLLRQYPGVVDCLVFGCPDDSHPRAESIVAVVAADKNVRREEIRDFLLGRLPSWQLPRDWWFVDALPANVRGKVSRAAWREKYLASRRR